MVRIEQLPCTWLGLPEPRHTLELRMVEPNTALEPTAFTRFGLRFGAGLVADFRGRR